MEAAIKAKRVTIWKVFMVTAGGVMYLVECCSVVVVSVCRDDGGAVVPVGAVLVTKVAVCLPCFRCFHRDVQTSCFD